MLVKALRASTHLPDPGGGTIMATHGHLRIPPGRIQANKRVLYMFGDPRDAVVSFFDRRNSRHGRHGFNAKIKDVPDDSWVLKHCANIESSADDMDKSWDLRRFLDNGLDCFRLKEHFDNWCYSDVNYDIVFVRYESIWDNKAALAKMLGLTMDRFPEKIERRSKWDDLEDEDKSRCDELYGAFARRLAGLPDLFTVRQGEIIACSSI